jgi:hypothetical protein
MLADKGKFSSPTSKELAKLGVDTTTWNEGKGFMPKGIWKTEKRLKEEAEKQELEKSEVDTSGNQMLQRPDTKGQGAVKEHVKKIVSAGPNFRKPREKDEKPSFTMRKWKGEHSSDGGKTWELKPGYWWNPLYRKKTFPEKDGRPRHVEVKGGWQRGIPRLGLFYWSFEFMWDPTKYVDPVPYGKFHREIAERVEYLKKYVILVGRDHLKTTFFNVNDMCWRILEFPEKAKHGLLNIAWDPGLAEVTFLDVNENLSMNPKILSFYGYVIDESRPKTQEKIYFTYQPIGAKFGLRCTSFKSGSITGSHPWKVYIDDPEDEPLSPTFMEKFKRIINKKLIPAVGKAGIMQLTGTVKGWDKNNDGYLWLERNRAWKILRYPAANAMPPMSDVVIDIVERIVFDEAGEPVLGDSGDPIYEDFYEVTIKDKRKYKPLYPERFTIEDLVIKRLEMADEGKSDDDFWSEYFLQAVNPSGKYFLKDRVRAMPPPGYIDVQSFSDHCFENHEPIYMWIDPGGASSHGIAVSVGTKMNGRYYLLDFLVLRTGLPEVAKTIGRLIKDWRVTHWGCEGNFSQAETYGRTLDREVYNYMHSNGWDVWYSPCVIKNNTGKKFQRIATHLSNMIGLASTDYTFYVNTESKDFDLFNRQLTTFGPGAKKTQEHDFDLLDCIASLNIHMFGFVDTAVCIAV